jgi:hypothetical protein
MTTINSASIKFNKDQAINLHDAFERIKKAAKDGNSEFAHNITMRIYRKSQVRVPVDTTALKKSGEVATIKRTNGIQMSIKYGGETTLNSKGNDYAIYVHEIPPDTGGRWGTGNKHKPPTTYKFLEIPATEEFTRADIDLYKSVASKLRMAWSK